MLVDTGILTVFRFLYLYMMVKSGRAAVNLHEIKKWNGQWQGTGKQGAIHEVG
jgi:hypothetical protein